MIHPQDAAKTMQEAAQAGRLEQIKKNGTPQRANN